MRPAFQLQNLTPHDARCALHPDTAANATCARCGSFACHACSRFGDDGSIYCVRCERPAHEIADRGSRFVANLVDNLLLVVVVVAAMVPVAATDLDDSAGVAINLAVFTAFAWLLALLAFVAVQIAMQVRYGQSIGKKLMGIQVVRTDGSPASLARLIFLRNGVPQLINALCGIFSLVDVLFIFAADSRCVHDMLADTIVVRVPRA